MGINTEEVTTSQIKSNMSTDLLDMLTNFFILEIGSKFIDGITYTMIRRDKISEVLFKEYMAIRKEATKCGYTLDEIFRVYEVCNGYIFDMDTSIGRLIAAQITKAVNSTNEVETGQDMIGDSPEARRKGDMVGLAKYIKQQYDNGKNVVEVALFNRNSSSKIVITATDPKKNQVSVSYQAFALTHRELTQVNSEILMPAGIRISTIQTKEILPGNRGVNTNIYIEKFPL